MDIPLAQQVPPPAPKNNSGVLFGILVFILGIAVGLTLDKTTLLSALRIPYFSVAPTPTLILTPTPTPNSTANWQTYTNTKFDFEFQYPTEAKITTRDPDPFPVVVQVENVAPRNGDAGSIYWGGWFIFISEPQSIQNNESLIQWAKQKLVSDLLIKQGSQTQPADTKIDNQEAIYWRSKGGGVDLLDYLVKTKNGVILITINPATGYETVVNQILSTFRFLDNITPSPACTPLPSCAYNQNPNGVMCKIGENPPHGGTWCPRYICPANGWVDCMPGTSAKPECSAEAMTWYKANCPDFKGGAL